MTSGLGSRSGERSGRGPAPDRAAQTRRRQRGRCRGDHGDVVPLVVVTPIMVFMVMLAIQMGLYFHARSVMSAAAQDAARAAQHEDGTEADGYAAANQILAGSESLLIGETTTVDQGPTEVTVNITAEVTSLVPFFTADLSVEASGPRESFRPESAR